MPRLNSLSGVRAAGTTSVIPFGGGWSTTSFSIEGLTVPPGQNGPWGDIRIATPRFFDALRIPLKKGRAFTGRSATYRLGDPVTVELVEAAPVAGALRFRLLHAAHADRAERTRQKPKEQRKLAPGGKRSSGHRKSGQRGKKR